MPAPVMKLSSGTSARLRSVTQRLLQIEGDFGDRVAALKILADGASKADGIDAKLGPVPQRRQFVVCRCPVEDADRFGRLREPVHRRAANIESPALDAGVQPIGAKDGRLSRAVKPNGGTSPFQRDNIHTPTPPQKRD